MSKVSWINFNERTRRFPVPLILIIGVFVFSAFQLASAMDWPQWRGPDHDGISREKGWLTTWPKEGPKQLWTAAVGTGFSSVAVSGGRVYTMGNTGNIDKISCLDADTGSPLWKYSYHCDMMAVRHEGGPGATPAVDGDRVYTLSREGHLFCFNAASGKVIWRKDLQEDPGAKRPTYGFTSSPLVEERSLILNVGGSGLAVDKTTGEIIWESGKKRSGYGAPVPFTLGQRCAAIFTSKEIVGVRVIDGKVLWQYPWKTRWDLNIADPIVSRLQI